MKPPKLWTFLTLTIPTGILLAIHAYLGSFTRLIADDYCTMYNARTFGVFGTALLWYRTWTGVYARALINEILLWIGPYHMWVIVPGILLIWLVITTLALRLLLETETQPNNRVWVSFSLSMILLFSILLLSPRLTQSLYWWGGLSAYTVPLILGTIFLILFLLITRRGWDRRFIVIWRLISFLLAFGLGGISESFTPILLVLIAAAFGWRWLNNQLILKSIAFWFLGSALIGASFALIFMISAPGNAIRQANFPPSPGIVEIFRIATNGYFEFIGSLLTQPPISAGVLGVWLGAVLIGGFAANDHPPRVWTIPAALLFGMAIAYLCFPPTAYGMSNVPPRRVLIISAFFLSAGLITSGYLAGKWSSHRMVDKSAVTAGLLLAVTLLLSYSSWVTSRTLYESRQTFVEFANLWDQVDAQILQAKANGDESITIPAMSSWTGLDRPNENPKFWATKCYSDFYGIQIFGPPYGP
ncbi:MAG: hypothetical protein DCC56_03040 [Anaerolineae bacterium]|nr:MAG: hypothetical protein DCC56_03040 [Anaerolineae bacterium]WKZ44188.1 MAG: hypothetical protein QY302_00180 [Anaerolineales bacterium]